MVAQTEQESTLEVNEKRPASQVVQLVAPADVPVFVVCITSQFVHDATLDAIEKRPGTQAVHTVAPALVPVFVIDPA
jgi:hypothetical protein